MHKLYIGTLFLYFSPSPSSIYFFFIRRKERKRGKLLKIKETVDISGHERGQNGHFSGQNGHNGNLFRRFGHEKGSFGHQKQPYYDEKKEISNF